LQLINTKKDKMRIKKQNFYKIFLFPVFVYKICYILEMETTMFILRAVYAGNCKIYTKILLEL